MRFSSAVAAILAVSAAPSLAAPVQTATTTTTVSLAGVANYSWSSHGFAGIPTGSATLGGIDFAIAADSNGARFWSAHDTGQTGTITLDLPVSIADARTIYTLAASYWGSTGTYQTLTVSGTGGVSQTFSFTGNTNLRDYQQGGWANTIVAPTTTVYTQGSRRLDMQKFELDDSFIGQTITQLTFKDTGAAGLSRLALTGVSVVSQGGAVPEPAGWALMALGFGLVGGAARTRRAIRPTAVAG